MERESPNTVLHGILGYMSHTAVQSVAFPIRAASFSHAPLCEPPRQQRMRGALSPLVTSRTSVRGCIRARHPCAEAEVATEVHVEDRGARLRPAPRNARLARRRWRAYWKLRAATASGTAAWHSKKAICAPGGCDEAVPATPHTAAPVALPARAIGPRRAPSLRRRARPPTARGRPTSDIRRIRRDPASTSVRGRNAAA